MLYYSLHRDELLVWTVTASRATLSRKPVGQDEVDRLTQRFLRSFTLADELGGDAGRELAEILLGANDLLAGVSTLVIVPDGPLGNLPFSALPDPRTGRHLAESAAVLVAPSATHYLLAREQAPRRARGRSVASALVVGDPRGESDLFPDLPALPGASREAHRVASLYRSSNLLLGREATRRAFLRNASRHEVIHFAGHAATRALLPSMAGLVFSPEPDGSPLLLARDVSSLGLNDVHLVVLSACGTGATGTPGTAGHESLAQAFLAAGVPSVLASLWPLDDATTSGVVESFHRHFLDGLPPAQALRAAQLEALRSPDPAARSSWAAFQLIGS
jgi:CHAT domain-containing protein